MYETFDHTADVGVRASAADLPSLFREAARGLLSLLVENVDAVKPTEEVEVRIDEADREYLLFDWLRELLYFYDARQLLTCDCEVEIRDAGLVAKIRGETADTLRHRLAHEVKAITTHGLRIQPNEKGFEAEFIVDI